MPKLVNGGLEGREAGGLSSQEEIDSAGIGDPQFKKRGKGGDGGKGNAAHAPVAAGGTQRLVNVPAWAYGAMLVGAARGVL